MAKNTIDVLIQAAGCGITAQTFDSFIEYLWYHVCSTLESLSWDGELPDRQWLRSYIYWGHETTESIAQRWMKEYDR